MDSSEIPRRPRIRGGRGRGRVRTRGGRGRGLVPTLGSEDDVGIANTGGEEVQPTRGNRRARARTRGGVTGEVVGRVRGGRGRARGGGELNPVADAAKFFCGLVTNDRVVGVPEGTAIHMPLHKKRPRSWHPAPASSTNTTVQSPSPSPAASIEPEIQRSPRISLTNSPVPSPAAFIDYEMSPGVSLTSSPTLASDESERMKELQSRSSPVTSKADESREHDYHVPLKKRKLVMDKPTSKPARSRPLKDWEIEELLNNDYGSEDDDDDMDDGDDGPMFPMSSVMPRTQRAWLDELMEEERVSEIQSSSQITVHGVLPQHDAPSVSQLASPLEVLAQETSPSVSQLASPLEVLAQETSPSASQLAPSPEVEISSTTHPRQISSSQPVSEIQSAGITEKPYSLWEFQWESFSERSVPPPSERMETFDRPTGPVRSFHSPYDVFTAIWDTQILQHIVEQTNNYAQLITARQMEEGTLGLTSRLVKWKDLSVDELYVYFALLLAMGLVYKSNIREYWASQGDITDTPNFGKYMSVNRFENITRALHFNDNCDPQLRTLPKPRAKLFKIQPILDHLNVKFQELFNLSRDIALDESLTEWKGWLDINQFIKNKSASIGIKSYEICDSRTGYLWRFKIHAGREETEEQDISPVSGITSKIVQELVRDLEHRGHVLFMDNYYNSPALARRLKTLGFDVVGTLRTNRQFVPSEFRMAKTQMTPGQIYGATSGDVDIVVWRDQNKVCMISTYHGMTQFRRDGNTKPSVIHDYNVCMGGVDRKDQMLSMYPIERKRTRVWYKKLFRRLFNVSILNSYIILKASTQQLQHRQFRKELIKQLLDVHSSPALTPVPRMAPQPCTFKYSTAMVNHFPIEYGLIPGQAGRRIRRSCIKCHTRTFTHCPACNVALCLNRCFVEYHT